MGHTLILRVCDGECLCCSYVKECQELFHVFIFEIMIAKGRTDIEADIDFMYEAYKSLIDRIECSYSKDIQTLKSIVQSIETDCNIDYEEKTSLLNPYFEAIDILNTQNQKAQTALFCSIYSFWEKSLLRLCQYYKKDIRKKDGSVNYASRITDYLKALLEGELIANIPKALLNELGELRNYFIHGTLPPQRESIIKNISPQDSISILKTYDDYVLASFAELHKTLELIYKTLQEIQHKQDVAKL